MPSPQDLQSRAPAKGVMATIPQALAMARNHHQAGRLPQAEDIYQAILRANPRHVDALHSLKPSLIVSSTAPMKAPAAPSHNSQGARPRTRTALDAIAPVVANALIRTKLKCLNGKSLSDVVCWNGKRQTKAVALKNILLAGGSDIPKDIGSVYPTLVGSAAS